MLVGGVAGTWLGGWLGDRLGPARPGAYALIPACCFLVTAPAFALGLFAPNLWVAWLLFTLGQMTALAWLGPVISAVQHIVQPAIRATASASFLFINNLIGIAFGIYFLGWLSDRMKAAHGDEFAPIFDPLRARLLPAQRGHLLRRGEAAEEGLGRGLKRMDSAARIGHHRAP